MHQAEFIFAYGSNMDPAQMRERCPESSLTWFIAEARNYALCFPRKSTKRRGGVGSLMPENGSSVWGVVFAISERDLLRLDRFEGVPKSYTRKEIEVFDLKHKPHIVWVHLAVPQENGPYKPHRDYLALYISGATYYGLPADYLAKLNDLRNAALTS
jgi:gamma-glutamylcyclotransferase (GGCT)/AIG2-like uncharacterized protein YtfP